MKIVLATMILAAGFAARAEDTKVPVKPGYQVIDLGPEPTPKNAPRPKDKPDATYEQTCETPSGQTLTANETGFDGCLVQRRSQTKIKETQGP